MLALLFAVAQVSSRVEAYQVDGVTRQALVFPGMGIAPPEGRPLVLAFHGHGGSMAQAARSFGVQRLWPEATVVYPDGLPTVGMLTDPQGRRKGWQSTPGGNDDRDLKLVDLILGSVRGVDRRRVYAMGHSNGGRFVYVLWAARGDRFAAYGVSGSPATGLLPRLRPASLFATAGQSDPLVPFEGQKRTIDAVATLDGVDLAKGTTTGYATLAKGWGDLEVGTYFSPAGHAYPPDAVAATVELFKRHTR